MKMYSRCGAAKEILNQLFALSRDKKKGVTSYERQDVDGEESVTAVGGNKMKTKVHCIKVLCCGLIIVKKPAASPIPMSH